MKIERFYIITYRAVGTNYPWRKLSDTEYTAKEANAKVKQLNNDATRYESPFVFRKQFIYSAPVQTLSVRNHKYA